jgi:dephospho-CoA kinase
MSELSVKSRMKTQWTDEKKKTYADFIIVNDEKQSLLTQVLQEINHILKGLKFESLLE